MYTLCLYRRKYQKDGVRCSYLRYEVHNVLVDVEDIYYDCKKEFLSGFASLKKRRVKTLLSLCKEIRSKRKFFYSLFFGRPDDPSHEGFFLFLSEFRRSAFWCLSLFPFQLPVLDFFRSCAIKIFFNGFSLNKDYIDI